MAALLWSRGDNCRFPYSAAQAPPSHAQLLAALPVFIWAGTTLRTQIVVANNLDVDTGCPVACERFVDGI
jgi:hypothetical protein